MKSKHLSNANHSSTYHLTSFFMVSYTFSAEVLGGSGKFPYICWNGRTPRPGLRQTSKAKEWDKVSEQRRVPARWDAHQPHGETPQGRVHKRRAQEARQVTRPGTARRKKGQEMKRQYSTPAARTVEAPAGLAAASAAVNPEGGAKLGVTDEREPADAGRAKGNGASPWDVWD